MRTAALLITSLLSGQSAWAMDLVRQETGTDQAVASYGVSGKGVTIAILDRGIDWGHPDFVKPDGTTRIRAMLDQSGQNLCSGANPAPVEYSEAQINAALAGGPTVALRDAVGHGTATAGTAASNGRAIADLRYRGIAPQADLIIVKMVSEGAAAHDTQPAETAFQGCIDQAIDWAAAKFTALGQPGVLLINSGTQWGPMDGTSAVSRKLESVFPSNVPGRIVVLPSGDEGSLANHAGTDYDNVAGATVAISKATTAFAVMSGWYTGSQPSEITVTFDDGTSVGPVAAGTNTSSSNATGTVTIYNYAPGTEFYPWTSNGGDRAVWIGVDGHATTGSVKIRSTAGGSGHFNLYGDVSGANLTPVISMSDHLVPGRLTDYATTQSVIVAGDYNLRTSWTDIDGIARSILTEGVVGDLWLKSSAGPTRDGRARGVDLVAPGQNLFASVARNSYFATLRFNQPQGAPDNYYVRFGGTSGAAPIVLGAVALMLQADPLLTTEQARQILRNTARADTFTGAVPNNDWGSGKLDVNAAVGAALALNVVFKNSFE